MPSFAGYGKIPLGRCDASDPGGDWCVTEKVHGANFSVHLDRSGTIHCAKRTGFLKEHEDFFGHFEMLHLDQQFARLLLPALFVSLPV